MGLAQDRRRALRNPGFVSFMAQNNRQRPGNYSHERIERTRRWLRNLAVTALVLGCAWIAIESAKALSVF
ncbi:hypothetical protein AXK11_04115 [Cephaloticoccus primus]|uniref:Uncharacterized protein n=2 Tax=Cephaloticoccus primus TaxID=1548207 RepID=A0A139SPT3_9BACT|nr:hypothetical protein AXK11_04115 [Cephaloticoccus primus]